jgi:benzoyl-CoA reductase/2-hydroxyglutaryl-CoA dehydratase subunit BcrC/BadD/HgdB
MTTITAKIPDNLKDKLKKFIEELGGEVVSESKLSKKKTVLKELEAAFSEAKEIKEGKKQGYSLEQILLAK